ncbi:Leucine rich repeat 4 [Arabidopsis thaliana x Arabidopsis arenosa]|uniref:Leucine rich repeat 4 n=1 Tax=Arabidopsis thaliana x Arabidopsis arenosa TaxID=1240361 RepID=A0A8T2B2Z5_9BRAS|nr:Leucine rich repeat 4 [Arabidopsis thaliana x Arabidopsis arenosa]KAG7578424.1 Leucine rich repeat 4 [Arabidopsis thaliana x Arabidopsis arenosa]
MIMRIFLFSLALLVVASVVEQGDRAAMLAVSRAFQPHPRRWSTISSFAYCKWRGVTCNHNNHLVISLNISGLSLGGTISPEIGHLSEVQEVYLQNNNLTGEVPSSLAALPSLRILDVSNNNLSGVVPEFERSVKVIYRPGNPLLKDRPSSGKAMTEIGRAFIILAIGFIAGFYTRLNRRFRI